MTTEVQHKAGEGPVHENKSIDVEEQPVGTLTGDALREALRKQVEYYFSRENLSNDTFLVSQMNSQMYVPLSVLAGFQKVKALTDDTKLIAESIRNSKVCSLNDDETAVKPNIKSERNTIILREIPSDTAEEEVRAIFEGCGDLINVRSDVGDTWFVTVGTEEVAVDILLKLRERSFRGKPIKARLKSENILRSFYPIPTTEVAPSAFVGVNPAPYYVQPMTWGAPPAQYGGISQTGGYMMNPQGGARQYRNQQGGSFGASNGERFQGRRERGGRGGSRPSQSAAQPQSHGTHSQQGPKEARKGPAGTPHLPADRAAQRKPKDKKPTKPERKDKQPILNAANFPPLPTSHETKSSDFTGPGYSGPFQKYLHDEVMEIVKHMDDQDCTLPADAVDLAQHSLVLNEVAHPELLRNQRTYSIDQAREAMRQGRPIRSDSVGSADYESMMYGEEYTKEARQLRETRKQAAIQSSSTSHVTHIPAAVVKSEPPTSPSRKTGSTSGAASPAAAAATASPVEAATAQTEAKSEAAAAPSTEETSAQKEQPKPALKKGGYAAALLANSGAPPPVQAQRPKVVTAPANKKDDRAGKGKPTKAHAGHHGGHKRSTKPDGKPHQKKGPSERKAAEDGGASPPSQSEGPKETSGGEEKEANKGQETVNAEAAEPKAAAAWGGKRSFLDVLKTSAPAVAQSPTGAGPGNVTPSSSRAPREPTKSPRRERGEVRNNRRSTSRDGRRSLEREGGKRPERMDRRGERTSSPRLERRPKSPRAHTPRME